MGTLIFLALIPFALTGIILIFGMAGTIAYFLWPVIIGFFAFITLLFLGVTLPISFSVGCIVAMLSFSLWIDGRSQHDKPKETESILKTVWVCSKFFLWMASFFGAIILLTKIFAP